MLRVSKLILNSNKRNIVGIPLFKPLYKINNLNRNIVSFNKHILLANKSKILNKSKVKQSRQFSCRGCQCISECLDEVVNLFLIGITSILLILSILYVCYCIYEYICKFMKTQNFLNYEFV